MSKRITCEYCNKAIYITHKARHYNSNACRNKQQNKSLKNSLQRFQEKDEST